MLPQATATASTAATAADISQPVLSRYNRVKEHHGKPIFCVTFNTYDPANQDLVASVGGNQV
jgi:hypothetical protein